MKLISTLFSGEEIDITLTIQSQNKRDKTGKETEEPMIMRYKSRVGNESLIFQPKVAITIRSKDFKNGLDAWIVQTVFYRFIAALNGVYAGLQKDKLYHSDGGILFMDQKAAASISQKISLFRNSITLKPTIITSRNEQQVKGIALLIDGKLMGSLTHTEALAVIDQLDRFDLTTFTLLAGLVDELESMNRKMDLALDKLDNIERLLKESTTIKPLASITRSLPNIKLEVD